MNPYHSFLVTSIPWLAFTAALHAIEAPDDTTPPPNVAPNVEPQGQSIEKRAFIGIISQPVPQLLREHLKLEEQQGVLIKSLIPGGPADQAGFGVNDVLTGVDGTEISLPEDLSAAISKHKPGDKVSCALIHQGRPVQLEVTLGERPDEFAGFGQNMPQAGEPLQELGLPDDFADRIRRMLEEGGDELGMRMFEGEEMMRIPDVRKLRQQMNGDFRQLQLEFGKDGNIKGLHGAKIQMRDGDGSVEIETKNGSKEVTVKDSDGEIVWSGPWDTAQDKASAPDDIRERIERIDTNTLGGGLRLNFGPKNRE